MKKHLRVYSIIAPQVLNLKPPNLLLLNLYAIQSQPAQFIYASIYQSS